MEIKFLATQRQTDNQIKRTRCCYCYCCCCCCYLYIFCVCVFFSSLNSVDNTQYTLGHCSGSVFWHRLRSVAWISCNSFRQWDCVILIDLLICYALFCLLPTYEYKAYLCVSCPHRRLFNTNSSRRGKCARSCTSSSILFGMYASKWKGNPTEFYAPKI